VREIQQTTLGLGQMS